MTDTDTLAEQAAVIVGKLSADERTVLLEMLDAWIRPIDQLAADSGVPPKQVRFIVRGFHERDIADFGPCYDEDEGKLKGRGYSLNRLGNAVQSHLRNPTEN